MLDHRSGDVFRPLKLPELTEGIELAVRSKWLFRQPPLFRETLLRQAAVRQFSAGQKIIEVGEGRHDLYFLLQGAVQVSVPRSGAISPIHIVPSLHWFGEIGAVTENGSLARYVARVSSSALVIPRESLLANRHESPRYHAAMNDLLSLAMRDCFELASSVMGLEALARVKAKLLWLSENSVGQSEEGIISVSQGDLAIMAGVSRATVSKLLSQLEKAGVVEVGYRKVKLLKRHLIAQSLVPEAEYSLMSELL